MKSVKPLLVLAALLTGCAAPKPVVTNDQPVLTETTQYLPSQSYDEQGNKVAYVAGENPYLLQTGTISKGSVLLFIEAKKAITAEDDKTAEQKLRVITEKDTTLAGPWVLLGDLSMKKEQYAAAAKEYSQAISINKVNVNAYLGLAEAQRRQGQFVQAQNTYEAALKVWPDFPEAHLNLGVLYDLYLNLPAKAQAHYEAYLFLTHKKSGQAQDWYAEVQSRTGINTSFIDKGPATKAPAKVAAQ
ncbi:tetratricopeptide repeat protein [Thalassolituus sp. LLYu03]|uniref:tetratricopeptide repeat protein n=1 Tax=Thalassolituus sp. LLYu03 TaxID=3421656 RepID=UPI003D26BEC6